MSLADIRHRRADSHSTTANGPAVGCGPSDGGKPWPRRAGVAVDREADRWPKGYLTMRELGGPTAGEGVDLLRQLWVPELLESREVLGTPAAARGTIPHIRPRGFPRLRGRKVPVRDWAGGEMR